MFNEEDKTSTSFHHGTALPLPILSLPILKVGVSFMGDGPRGIEVFPDHFEASTSSMDYIQTNTSSISHQTTDDPLRSNSSTWARRKLRSAVAMLNLFGLRGLPWGSGNDQEKVVLSAAEVESLRAGLAELEERDAYLKAQLEHVDEILRSARLSGYLYIRTRWAALPGEPPPLDDTEVDDWLPRFLVLHGSCIFFYLLSTALECDLNIIARFGALDLIFSYIDDIREDLSPQDSTLLSDVTEVGPLPCFTREDGETRYCFYILTHHGLRFECSSASKVQVDSWLRALQTDREVGPDRAGSADSGEL